MLTGIRLELKKVNQMRLCQNGTSKSRASRFLAPARLGSAASMLALCFFGLAGPASASVTTLCPNQATVGGFGGTPGNVAGPLDGTCGTNSAVQINIPDSTDYGKLQFNAGMPGYPAGLTLGGVEGLNANVAFNGSGAEQPYFLLSFSDASQSLGQSSASDQILMIEFEANALSGSTLAVDPGSTLFNLYDNSTGNYLQGGQADTNTMDGWLADFTALDTEGLNGIWVAEGLTSGNSGPESLTVNSLSVSVPEPSSLSLFGAALISFAGFIMVRRRKQTGAG
jgi:hypothetical protein